MNRQAGKDAVCKLVKDFEAGERGFMSKAFQETDARTRFIDPFFIALGWELNQTKGGQDSWDVHREYSQKDNSVTKKPDYAFRVKEKQAKREVYRVKFFVEAKAPHVDLTDKHPVYQAKRYSFSSCGKTPIAILTDFQEFRAFNGLAKPVFENPLQGLIKGFDLKYRDYPDAWDTLWNTFSKEAVAGGSIERLAGTVSRNTKTFDDEFLSDLSGWREALAKKIALRNEEFSVEQINEAVQRILDRLIFIRNLEDRGIEPEDTLLAVLGKKENIYRNLIPIFRKLDIDYNGLLFKKHFSEDLTLYDPDIRDIIKKLCPPYSPYAFDMIEPEILGRIYERFLGSKIRLTAAHQVKVDEKPEVRKAGGVYYTPEYIVDYIVANTVGEKIKGKTPAEIAEIRICDPACGSGSFLLGAFQYLIDYHCMWYADAGEKDAKECKDDFMYTEDGDVRLTIKKKTEILRNNIYGVDIDREATEVAIMSLYLKILDDGYDRGQGELFMKGSILPDMTGNIKCGNSLIGMDFLHQPELQDSGADDETMFRVNPFDWKGADGFPEIFKAGGFDCVIGNPPYVLVFNELVKNYLENNFIEFQRNNDQYVAFIVKGILLLRENGVFSFITPNTYLKGNYFKALRNFMMKYRINEIVDFCNGKIFKDATVFTAICNISKNNPAKQWVLKSGINTVKGMVNSDESIFIATDTIIKKLDSYKKFDEYFLVKDVGYNYWSIGRGKVRGDSIGSRVLYAGDRQDNSDIPFYKGSNIQKYILTTPCQYLRHNYSKFLKNNDIFRFTPDILEAKPKIIYRQTSSSLIGAIDNKGFHNDKTVHVILPKDVIRDDIDLRFVLALFNSKLLNYFYLCMTGEEGRAFAQVKTIHVKNLPFVLPDNTRHDNIVSLVDKIIEYKQQEAAELGEQRKNMYARIITEIDKQIDAAVYTLYDLTDEEIAIVEGR